MLTQPFSIPDFLDGALPGQPAPIELMRQAAHDFTAKMSRKILGDVVTINPGGANLFRHTFQLIVPSLNDYVYPLFYVWHEPSLYPANLMIAGGNQDKDAKHCPLPDNLREEIEKVFLLDSTRLLVRALVAQIEVQNSGDPIP